jgi:hypothetical protein
LNNQYNVWNKWDKLKTVVLGDIYKPEFYKDIKSKVIKDSLLKICEESLEDLESIENILKDFGCEVLRPHIESNVNIMDYIIDGKIQGIIPRPPLMPRDAQFVCGNKLLLTHSESTPYIYHTLKQYNHKDIINFSYTPEFGVIEAPCYTMVGKDIYVDTYNKDIEKQAADKLKDIGNDLRISCLNHGGHSDACFHTLKEGAIISLNEIQDYKKTFPGWDILYLENEEWTNNKKSWIKLKRKNKGKWWVPGEESNDEFTNFVETWLNDWVGYMEETVFDINILVLDEYHVGVSNNNNKQVNAFLRKHKMEPVYMPWRHRFFHDGGLHCITLDLYRESKQKDYFPLRGNNGVTDYGFERTDKA